MKNVYEITREDWVQECFPEWKDKLLDEIESTKVRAKTFAMWWLGCCGIWVKTEYGTNLCVDLFTGNGRSVHEPVSGTGTHPLVRISGSRHAAVNVRNIPHYIDPFQIKNLDLVLATHSHPDHMDLYSAAALCRQGQTMFAGPEFCVEKWRSWGIPDERIIQVKPGDTVHWKDIEIQVVESFDRTALVTAPPDGSLCGYVPDDMDRRAVNYVIKTSGGTIYHAGDSHFSDYSRKHGKQYEIDVALAAYAENPPGLTDKMTSSDVLRMAENLNCKVVIPLHYDIWMSTSADPEEIQLLYDFRNRRLRYSFKPYTWKTGGCFVYPDDKEKRWFSYPRLYEDAMEEEPDLPYRAFL